MYSCRVFWWQRWGRTVTVHNGRRRHAARGAETIRGGWRVEGTSDIQVDGDLLWERRWVPGERERVNNEERYWFGEWGRGGVKIEEVN